MTLEEIANAALTAPGIRQGFVQVTFSLSDDKSVRNQGGGFQREVNQETKFRVGLYDHTEFKPGMKSGAGYAECESPSLITSIRIAFKTLGVKLPADLAEKPKTPKP